MQPLKQNIEEKLEISEQRIDYLEKGYRDILEFVDKIENLSQFQDRLEIPASLGKIWEAFLENTKNIIETDVCAFFLVDDETHEFVLKGVTGYNGKQICQEELNSQIECGIFSWIINRRKAAIIPSLALKKNLSIIMMPLSTVKRTLGVVLIVTRLENQEITNESIQLLNMLARQCSLVIENTLLYQSLKVEHENLNEARARTLQAEKLASLGRLTDGAFHEILNPLNIISGQIQVLQRFEELTPKMTKFLGNMKEQSERIARIVNGLLQFSRHSNSERRLIDINNIIDGVLTLLHHELSLNKISVIKTLSDDLPAIYGNEEKLSQVFYNLISNAKDAMEEGGTLEISSEIIKDKNNESNEEKIVVIDVKDTGCGIAEKNKNKIFDPFFSTKKTGKGTGLGLSLSYGIIEDHGGSITLKSSSKNGSIFCIRLPANDE